MGSSTQKPAYQNDQYWNARLEREFNLQGVGHADVSVAFNLWAYRVRKAVLLRALKQDAIPIEGARILELGFGTGYYLDLWRALNAGEVTGFDITHIAVQSAQERFKGLRWRLERADIGAPLDFAGVTGKYDLATAFDVLMHLVDDQKWNAALDNIAAALRPGGYTMIFDKFQPLENAMSHSRRRSLATYRAALEARGFEIVAVKPLLFFMHSPVDYTGLKRFLAHSAWTLVKAPYKIGKRIGLGETFGGAMGALLYFPELFLTATLPSGPSKKLLVARKRLTGGTPVLPSHD